MIFFGSKDSEGKTRISLVRALTIDPPTHPNA
jgi:hypothetical protein